MRYFFRSVSGMCTLFLLAVAPQLAWGQVWEGPRIIGPGPGIPGSPRIALGPNGNAIATFLYMMPLTDSSFNLYAANYISNFGWQAPLSIEKSNSVVFISLNQYVATASNGNAMVVFTKLSSKGDSREAYANYYTYGGTWSGPFPIYTFDGNSDSAGVALDANGNAFVVLLLNGYLYGMRYDAATSSWNTEPVRLDNADPNEYISEIEDMKLVMDTDGNAVVIFKAYNRFEDVYHIYATRYIAKSKHLVHPVRLDDPAAGWADSPDVAFGPCDHAIAVFEQDDSDHHENSYANYFNGLIWSGPQRIVDSPWSAFQPQIAYSPNGDAVAVFAQYDGTGNLRIYADRFNGSAWSGATVIDAGTGERARFPHIVMDAYGNAVVIFSQNDGNYDRLYANRFAPDSGWGQATIIDAGTRQDIGDSCLASDENGNAIAVFYHLGTSTSDRLYANRYIAPTPSITSLPRIYVIPDKNTFSTSDTISITASAQHISAFIYPFVRIIFPNGQVFYYVRGRGFSSAPASYLPAGPITVSSPITNYPVLSVPFSGIVPGTYILEGGAVYANRIISMKNAVYINPIDRKVLTVQ